MHTESLSVTITGWAGPCPKPLGPPVYTRVRWSFPGGLPGPLNYSVTVAYRSPVTAQLLDSADCGQPCLAQGGVDW